MPVPTIGDNVKVVERAKNSDTKIVTEGIVTAVDEANNRLDFDITKTKVTDTANVSVKVEIQQPPLPTTPGSVLSVNPGFDAPFFYFLTVTGWVDHTGSLASLSGLQRAENVTIVFDAGA